ncbi:MAG: polysaccharide deacetylase family protein [Candidatus Omnitrophica bacterium]|nr:polysaccharide deacetylase family protein [Candidatus Omnitrophota bacterium]
MFREKKKFFFLGLFLVIILSTIVFLRSQYVIPILMYHSIKPEVERHDRISVSVASFERQMSFLVRNNYRVLTLEEVVDYLRNKKRLPLKTVAITFDDGHEDNFIYAFPIIKKYQIPVTVFLIVDAIGKPGFLTEEQIRQMQDSGLVSFGSHTLSHPYLTELNDEEKIMQEICDSKNQLEDILGKPVIAFAYPFGRFNQKIKKMVQEKGYLLAVASKPTRYYCPYDFFALRRIRISETASNLFLFWFKTSGYYNMFRSLQTGKNG